MSDKFGWLHAKYETRFPAADNLQNGDIVMKLPDGRLYLIGSGGCLRQPSPWDRLLSWWFHDYP